MNRRDHAPRRRVSREPLQSAGRHAAILIVDGYILDLHVGRLIYH
jgi:hypothetical protein